MADGADISIGSRPLRESNLEKHQPLYREMFGRMSNKLIQLLAVRGIQDTQCGFKMFRGEIIRPLWDTVQIKGFGFDLEVLFLAQRMNYKIKEVGVSWKHVENSKVNLIKDSWRMLVNIFQIRKMHHNR